MITTQYLSIGVGKKSGIECFHSRSTEFTAKAFGAEDEKSPFRLEPRHDLSRQLRQFFGNPFLEGRLRPDYQRGGVELVGKLEMFSQVALRSQRVPLEVDVDISLNRSH